MAERDYIHEALQIAPRDAFRERLKRKLREEAARMKTTVEESVMNPAVATYVRPGMHSLNPYLVTKDAEKVLEFIKGAFGGEELIRMDRPDGTIMHSETRVGDTVIEVAQGDGNYQASPMALHVYVKDADAVYTRALEAGGESLYAMTDMPYGDREGGVKDGAGNYWFIATHGGESHVPEGLRAVTLGILAKDPSGLIEFVKEAFGAQVRELVRNPADVVVHSKLAIGDSIMELSEAHGAWAPMSANIHIYVADADAVYAQAIAAGAKMQSEPADTPYGDRAAGVVDAWGNQWWIATYQGEHQG